jgi:protein phosphatase-4 regulatory subunit 3
VKVYTLNPSLQWEDKGTGYVVVAVTSLQVGKAGPTVVVKSEKDGSFLLQSKVNIDNDYKVQEETMIVWQEPDGSNHALSFQDKSGCDEIWEVLKDIQSSSSGIDYGPDGLIEDGENTSGKFDDIPPMSVELPTCEMSQLGDIAEVLTRCLSVSCQRQCVALTIEQEGYIPKLLELFHMCEDLDDTKGLHHLFDIFSALFLLNQPALLSIMLHEEIIMDVIGCLEYNPSKPELQKHREFVESSAKFHEVVPIKNSELLSKIHLLYKVLYVKEVILPTPSVFEEHVMAALNSFIRFTKVDIVSGLQQDVNFITQLFGKLLDEDTSDREMTELGMLLREINNFSQALQNHDRTTFYQTLLDFGLFNALEVMLSCEIPSVVAASVDILTVFVEFSSAIVREYILQQAETAEEENHLLNVVISILLDGQNADIDVQLVGLVKMIIDPELMITVEGEHIAPAAEKTTFLTYFYKHCMHRLTAPLMANTAGDHISKDTTQNAILLGHVLEVLSLCVARHQYYIRHYILNKNLLGRVLVLMTSTHSHLSLSALRFCRKIVGLKDEFYNKYIIRQDLFRPIVRAFTENGSRYNLLNSAIIELFDYIRIADSSSLIAYVSDQYMDTLEKIDYVDTFQKLKRRHLGLDVASQVEGSVGIGIPKGILHTPVDDGRFRRDPRALDEDEELWFEGEDELENIDPSNSLVPPLTPPISLSGKNKLVLECELKPELSPGLDSSPPSSHVGTPRPTRADMELFKPLSKSSSPPPPTLKPVSHLHIQSNLGKRKFRGPTTLVLIIRSSSYQDILPNQTGS